jgi:predicted DNA-binding protein YlxM (UPF0122 family)
MFHFQVGNGIFQNTQQIYVCMYYQVGDVSMNENLSRLSIRDLVGRHPAVTAAYPEKFRCLNFTQTAEEFRVILFFFPCPGFVFQ